MKNHKVASSQIVPMFNESPKVDDPEYDAVFGERKEGQVDYKSVGWRVLVHAYCWEDRIKATIIMLKTIIALGVLAMPTVLSATGGVPGSLSMSSPSM
jgi:hypothetical protein